MKAFNTVEEYRTNTHLSDQKEFAQELHTWLGVYTSEVVSRVIKNMDKIISNQMALDLIHELHVRTEKERQEETSHIMFALGDNEIDHEGDWLHNHCITHAGSYRDILYDMFIKQ